MKPEGSLRQVVEFSLDSGGDRKSGILLKNNAHTMLIRYNGTIIKRHKDNHQCKIVGEVPADPCNEILFRRFR